MALTGDRAVLGWEAVTQAFEETQTQAQSSIKAGSPSAILLLKNQEGDLLSNQPQTVIPASLAQIEADQAVTSKTSESILKVVKAVECCQFFNEFLAIGQRLFMGKPESFLDQVFRLLSPESLRRVIGWSKQIPNSA